MCLCAHLYRFFLGWNSLIDINCDKFSPVAFKIRKPLLYQLISFLMISPPFPAWRLNPIRLISIHLFSFLCANISKYNSISIQGVELNSNQNSLPTKCGDSLKLQIWVHSHNPGSLTSSFLNLNRTQMTIQLLE